MLWTISFFITAEEHSIVWADNILIIHSSAGHLGGLPILVIMNNAAMGIHIQAFVRTYAFDSCGCTHTAGVPGSYVTHTWAFVSAAVTEHHLEMSELRGSMIHTGVAVVHRWHGGWQQEAPHVSCAGCGPELSEDCLM